jgi:hypothetical protein
MGEGQPKLPASGDEHGALAVCGALCDGRIVKDI